MKIKEKEMKLNHFIKYSIIAAALVLYLSSCKEIDFTGKEISFSPDGGKLAFINVQTKKLFVKNLSDDKPAMVIDSNVVIPQRVEWSNDGENLLYLKMKNSAIHAAFWQSLKNERHDLFEIAATKKEKKLIPITYPLWCSKNRAILLAVRGKNDVVELKKYHISNKESEMVWQGGCDKLLSPVVTATGEIIFAVKSSIDKNQDGIWIYNDGNSQRKRIFRGEVIDFSVAAEEGDVAVAIRDSKTDSFKIQVIASHKLSENTQTIFKTPEEIESIRWSPDGEKIGCVIKNEKRKNLFLIDKSGQATVKITFDNLRKFYGWGNDGSLIYSTEYPESLLSLSGTRKDEKEFHEIFKGIEIEQQLFGYDGRKIAKLGANLEAFQRSFSQNQWAYYSIEKSSFLGDDIYLAVLGDSSDKKIFFPDSREEFLLVADHHLWRHEDQQALEDLAQYWGFDIAQLDFASFFDIQALVQGEKIDSLKLDDLQKAVSEGGFSRSYVALKRRKLDSRAESLVDVFATLCGKIFSAQKEKYEEMMWGIITPFSRIEEFDSGIEFALRILEKTDFDSLGTSYLNFSQAVLSYEKSDYNGCLSYLLNAAKCQPHSEKELEPYNALLALCLAKSDKISNSKIENVFKILADKFSESDDLGVMFELQGDYFRRIEKKSEALSAYRQSLEKEPSESRVWRKLFQMEMERDFP